MSDTEKKYLNSSPKKTDYSTLIYLLVWLLLSGLIITGVILGYNYWEKKKNLKKVRHYIYDVKDEKPQTESKRKYEDARQNIYGNFHRVKKFNSKIAENRKELGVWQEDLDKIEAGLTTYEELKQIKHDPLLLEETYLEVYRQACSLSRLGNNIFTSQEIDKQLEDQEKWLEEQLEDEIKEAQEPIGKIIKHFYKKFWDELSPEKKPPWNIEPIQIQGRPANPANRKAEIDYLIKKYSHLEASGLHLLDPVWRDFTGFIEENSSYGDREGMNTMGVTIAGFDIPEKERPYTLSNKEIGEKGVWSEGNDIFQIFVTKRTIEIKLKKEFLFSRQNRYYTEWISDFVEDSKSRRTWRILDIGEECLLNTIAHELAHAIIDNTHLEYEKENGGHGDLHDDYTDEIEKMIEIDPLWDEFLLWWREKNNNG